MNENDSGNNENGDRRVFFVEYQDTGKQKNRAGWLPPQLKDKDEGLPTSSSAVDNSQYEILKSNWTKQFVEQQGIPFVVEQVLSLDFGNASQHSFELKNKSFLLTLLRVFIIAAIASQPNTDTSDSMQLLRRKSSIRGDAEEEKKEEAEDHKAYTQLISLLADSAGTELLLSLDFEKLQA